MYTSVSAYDEMTSTQVNIAYTITVYFTVKVYRSISEMWQQAGGVQVKCKWNDNKNDTLYLFSNTTVLVLDWFVSIDLRCCVYATVK